MRGEGRVVGEMCDVRRWRTNQTKRQQTVLKGGEGSKPGGAGGGQVILKKKMGKEYKRRWETN